jgi:hypothetical protein
MILTITPSGDLRCVYTEALDLDQFGQSDIRRASNVEPDPGHEGWYVQIVGGPKLLGFSKRSDAIRAEVLWLEEHVL